MRDGLCKEGDVTRKTGGEQQGGVNGDRSLEVQEYDPFAVIHCTECHHLRGNHTVVEKRVGDKPVCSGR